MRACLADKNLIRFVSSDGTLKKNNFRLTILFRLIRGEIVYTELNGTSADISHGNMLQDRQTDAKHDFDVLASKIIIQHAKHIHTCCLSVPRLLRFAVFFLNVWPGLDGLFEGVRGRTR